MTLIGHIVDKVGTPLVGYIGGIKGNTGRGIASIVENGDYTITINLTDGTSYTTAPIAGFTALAFDTNYDLVVTKTDGTTVTVETDLKSYETLLEGYKDDAESAKGDAETAQGYAESARDDAQTAQGKAEDAQSYAESARDDAQTAKGLAENARDSASASALKAEQWAKGTKNGTPVSSGDDGYNDNSKYYSGLASDSATNAGTSESNASASASSALADALKAEGYAVGKQNGTDVSSDSPYYHNNSKYYSEEASDSATSASGSASSASADALVAEGWAKGEQNGTPVVSGDYYNDNAKYYAEQAGVSVESLQIVNTASGEIASFADGADSINMKSVVADINPVQDLHGYDSPWVGGAGVNKYNTSLWEWTTSRRIWGTGSNSLTAALNTLPAGTYTIVGKIKIDSLTQGDSGDRTYGFLCTGVTVDGRTTRSAPTVGTVITITKTFTLSSANVGNFTKCYWYGGSGTATDDNCTVYDVGLNVGSETNFAPYENICPISGHTEVGVSVVGKNLFDPSYFIQNQTTASGSANTQYSLSDGVFSISRSSGTYGRYMLGKKLLKEGQYTLSFDVTDVSGGVGEKVGYSIRNMDTLTDIVSLTNFNWSGTTTRITRTFTVASQANIAFSIQPWSASGGTIQFTNCQLEIGSTATPYTEYNGQTITTQLGQTVYGGTLDLVSGVLTVDRAFATLVGGNWTKSGTYPGGFYIANNLFPTTFNAPKPKDNTPFICSHAKTATTLSEYTNGACYSDKSTNIRIMSADTTVSQWSQYLVDQNTAGTPVQVCYELATPTTTTLTAQQIKSLLGSNNVWADTGDVSVKYVADTKLYIDIKIQELNVAILALA